MTLCVRDDQPCTDFYSCQFLVVALYVDDISILGSTPAIIAQAQAELASAFTITDLGPLMYFLGLQVTHDRAKGTLIIHQTKFVQKIFAVKRTFGD